MQARKPARQTCTDHCVRCDAHFHGEGAFMSHIRGGEHRLDFASTKTGRPLLQVWTDTGTCRHSNGRIGQDVAPVTIYQTYASAFGSTRERA